MSRIGPENSRRINTSAASRLSAVAPSIRTTQARQPHRPRTSSSSGRDVDMDEEEEEMEEKEEGQIEDGYENRRARHQQHQQQRVGMSQRLNKRGRLGIDNEEDDKSEQVRRRGGGRGSEHFKSRLDEHAAPPGKRSRVVGGPLNQSTRPMGLFGRATADLLTRKNKAANVGASVASAGLSTPLSGGGALGVRGGEVTHTGRVVVKHPENPIGKGGRIARVVLLNESGGRGGGRSTAAAAATVVGLGISSQEQAPSRSSQDIHARLDRNGDVPSTSATQAARGGRGRESVGRGGRGGQGRAEERLSWGPVSGNLTPPPGLERAVVMATPPKTGSPAPSSTSLPRFGKAAADRAKKLAEEAKLRMADQPKDIIKEQPRFGKAAAERARAALVAKEVMPTTQTFPAQALQDNSIPRPKSLQEILQEKAKKVSALASQRNCVPAPTRPPAQISRSPIRPPIATASFESEHQALATSQPPAASPESNDSNKSQFANNHSDESMGIEALIEEDDNEHVDGIDLDADVEAALNFEF